MATALARRSPRSRTGLPSIFSTDPFNNLREEFDQLLSNWFADNNSSVQPAFSPPLDLTETEGEYQVQADLPGVQANEIKVQLLDNVLTISGERKYEKTEGKDKKNGGTTPHVVERYHGTFSRSILVPGAVKQDKIDAKYADGVLTVKLPKAAEQKPCEICVKS